MFNRLIVIVMVFSAVACNLGGPGDSGSGGDDEGESEEVEEEQAAGGVANGDYESIGNFVLNVRVVDLGSSTPPAEADCVGDAEVIVDDGAADQIEGVVRCYLPANAIDYEFAGEFISDDEWEGEIVLTLNSQDHIVDIEGELNGEEISGEFADRTPATGDLVIDWDGEVLAERVGS